jgi:hypothetical protein
VVFSSVMIAIYLEEIMFAKINQNKFKINILEKNYMFVEIMIMLSKYPGHLINKINYNI